MEECKVTPKRGRHAHQKNGNVSAKSLEDDAGLDIKEGRVGSLDQVEFIVMATCLRNSGFSVLSGTTKDGSGCLLCWMAKVYSSMDCSE